MNCPRFALMWWKEWWTVNSTQIILNCGEVIDGGHCTLLVDSGLWLTVVDSGVFTLKGRKVVVQSQQTRGVSYLNCLTLVGLKSMIYLEKFKEPESLLEQSKVFDQSKISLEQQMQGLKVDIKFKSYYYLTILSFWTRKQLCVNWIGQIKEIFGS